MYVRLLASIAISLTAGFLVGCSSSGDSPPQPSVPIPPGSPFSKIRIHESQKEVYDTIGPPTSTSENQTGKGFIPYYPLWGNDMVHVQAMYKGQGVITFGGSNMYSAFDNMFVVEFKYDPNESGYPQ